jgi:CRP-like cAMP-binding protein
MASLCTHEGIGVGGVVRETEGPAVRRVSLLRVDGELCAGMAPARRAEAERFSAAALLELPSGSLDDSGEASAGESVFGLFLITGLLCRHVGQGERTTAELIGPGDVFRPWEAPGQWSTIPVGSSWTVIAPSRVAILDRAFVRRTATFPEIAISINERSQRRVGQLATMMGVTKHRRVETRLLLLFWHLADRFGVVCTDGIQIPLRLTHAVLAEMVGLRRQTVTRGLVHLEDEGALFRRRRSGWLLAPETVDRCVDPEGASAALEDSRPALLDPAEAPDPQRDGPGEDEEGDEREADRVQVHAGGPPPDAAAEA